MSSLYLHIPFCHHRCLYCAFYSEVRRQDTTPYVEALKKEIKDRKNFIDNNLKTIYFGGGTPSLLNLKQVEDIFFTIENCFDTSKVEEITFEINTENASENYLKGLKEIGVNRLSIGVESFNDKVLHFLNRTHTAEESITAIMTAKKVGFDNISIDLMSNLPNFSFEQWRETLQIALRMNVPHISCYTLMIEENTMLDKLIKIGKLHPISENQAIQEFDYTMDLLEKNNYLHYETSSYAKRGFQSQHNMNYWDKQSSYLGVGTAAHSYSNGWRMWNKENINEYIAAVTCGNYSIIEGHEILSDKDNFNEYIMLSCRLPKGLNREYVKKNFPKYYSDFDRKIDECIKNGFLLSDLSLTRQGWHLQDELIVNLLA